MATVAADAAVLLDMTMTAIFADLALVSAHSMLAIRVAADIAVVLAFAMRTWAADCTVCPRAVAMWARVPAWQRMIHCSSL